LRDPNTPSATYRAIIDQLVNDTRLRGSGRHVRDSVFFSKSPSHREFNEFIGTLSERKRELLTGGGANELSPSILGREATLFVRSNLVG
jgi:hypothetical protein